MDWNDICWKVSKQFNPEQKSDPLTLNMEVVLLLPQKDPVQEAFKTIMLL